jgi:diguanylate cyclase (GGDEF)-like protein/PAS domain S-box-containing protein
MATILIVDDRPSNRQFLATLLAYGGHELLEAGDGAQALELVRERRPDLVVTDILMPTMDGYEFVQRVRADPQLAPTPVIFYTASYSTPQAEALAKSCGVQKVLAKPSEPQEILRAVNEALGAAAPAHSPLIAKSGAAAAPEPPIDDSLNLYLKDLEEVRLRFDDIVARSAKLRAERAVMKELSKKFADNVAAMQRITARLSGLLEVGMEMMTERDPARLVELFFAAACDLVGSKFAAVGMLDEREQAVRHVFAKGLDAAILRGEAGSSSLLATLLSGQRVLRMRSADGSAAAEGLPRGHPPVRDLLGVPVRSAERVYGWMYFAERRTPGGFTEEDARVASVMTRKLALLYENALLYDEIQRHAAQLQIETTERRRTQEALAESELRFRQMAENIHETFFWLTDPAKNEVLYVSPAYEQIWGRSCESVYASPRDWIEAIHVEDRTRVLLAAQKQAAGEYDQEYRIVRPDGSIRWIRDRAFPVLRDGRVYRIAGIAEDISERRQLQAALKEREAGLQRAQTMARLGHLITGPDGAFESWSETLPGLIGRDAERMPQSTREWLEVLHPEDRDLFRGKSIQAARTGQRGEVEYRLRRSDGAWVHMRQFMEPLEDPEHAQGGRWFNTLQNITEQKQAEIRIKVLNRVYAVLSGINTLIVRAPGREELFREACRIAVEQGHFRMAWIGVLNTAENRVEPVAWAGEARSFLESAPLEAREARAKGRGLAWEAIRDRRPAISNDVQNDPRPTMKDQCRERGINSFVILPLALGGAGIGVFALYAAESGFFDEAEMKLLVELAGDISFAVDHLAKAEKLNYLAYYDELTGLANRTLFGERLAQLLSAAPAQRVAVVLMDVERFRTINDSLGRQAGDALLKQIAERMSRHVGDAARPARLGADQFAAVVPDVRSEEEFMRRTEARMLEFFGAPFRLGDTELRIAAKAGIAMFPDDGGAADDLLRNAEAALKRAKATGERHMFYRPQMTERVAEKLALENKLRQALENDEFVLHYQPKVEVETRAIVGVEALIRWQSPERGRVPPGHFIPLLEETGLILPVGSWALKRASLDHRRWVEQKLHPPRVAVNVSQIQLRQREFVSTVEQAIMDGIAPTAIDLEITESLMMEDVKANIEKLQAVRGLGVRIAIDDFGTGYSSLGYLAQLPVESLKIDRSFISKMQDDPNAMALVSTIISLAHSLRLKVVAEGVETEEQAKFLRLLRCDEMQGFLVSKPVAPEALAALLAPGAAERR